MRVMEGGPPGDLVLSGPVAPLYLPVRFRAAGRTPPMLHAEVGEGARCMRSMRPGAVALEGDPRHPVRLEDASDRGRGDPRLGVAAQKAAQADHTILPLLAEPKDQGFEVRGRAARAPVRPAGTVPESLNPVRARAQEPEVELVAGDPEEPAGLAEVPGANVRADAARESRRTSRTEKV